MRRRKKLAIAGALVLGGLVLASVLRRDDAPSGGAATNQAALQNRRPSAQATLPVAVEEDEPTFLFGGVSSRQPSPTASGKDDPDNPPQLPRLSNRIDEDDDSADGAADDEFSPDASGYVDQRDRPASDGGADAWRPSSRVGIWQQFGSAHGRIEASRQWPADDVKAGDRPATPDAPPAGVNADDLAADSLEGTDDGRAREATGTVVHRIRDGDTLSGLARRYLGSRERYWEIYDANRDRLKDPDLLPIGVEIRIPTTVAGRDRGKPSMVPVGRRSSPPDR